MANDPDRDVLPVREKEYVGKLNGKDCFHTSSVSHHGYDALLVSKLKRSDLEDKYLRVCDENLHLKRLTIDQNGKIKKLGTKLLRVINGKKSPEQSVRIKQVEEREATEDLKLKLLELQHENYALKDKNVVLRQQLASHSRTHMAAHRSPVRLLRTHSSPRLGRRQESVPNIAESSVTTSNPPPNSEVRVDDPDMSNDSEIKRLQAVIEGLQKDLEEAVMSAQKIKLDENIEIIKLKRQCKQQDSQLRTLEHKYKRIQQDVARLQKENEDALLLMTERQNDVIDLTSKLNDALKYQQECQDLKEFIADLSGERDCLRDRCEALMTTISEYNDRIKVSVDQSTPVLPESASFIPKPTASQSDQIPPGSPEMRLMTSSTQTVLEEPMTSPKNDNVQAEISLLKSSHLHGKPKSKNEVETYDLLRLLMKHQSAKRPSETQFFTPIEGNENVDSSSLLKPHQLPSGTSDVLEGSLKLQGEVSPSHGDSEKHLRMFLSEKLKIQREVESLRDVLRSQTMRCDLQQQEIIRLQREARANESRFKDISQQRDLFFRLLDRRSSLQSNDPTTEVPSKSSGTESSPTQNTCIERTGTYTVTSPESNDDGNFEKNNMGAGDSMKPSENNDQNQQVAADNDGENDDNVALIPMPPPKAAPRRLKEEKVTAEIHAPPDIVTLQVSILWLQLEDETRLLLDSNVKALYVDFTILGFASESYETPSALKKPTSSNERCLFDFTADIIWEDSMHEKLKTFVATESNENVIVFNVVSEPPDETSASFVECAIVGTSQISLPQFLHAGHDEELLLPIYDADDNSLIGTLASRIVVPSQIISSFA